MKKIRVSIITPYYNVLSYIIESMLSVSNQKYNDNIEIEHVLIDDCSTDESNNIVTNFIQSQQKLGTKIIYNHLQTPVNIGCGASRKYGIDHSSGDYLMFLDGDDFYEKDDFIQRAVNDITENNADMVEYGVKYLTFFKDGPKVSMAKDKIVIENNPELAELMLFKENLIKFHVWTKIISRELSKKFDYSVRRKWEDVDTIPIWVSLANKIVIMPSIEVNYRTPENSIIMENLDETRLGTIEAISNHFERFKDNLNILKAMYGRAMIDLSAILNGHNSQDKLFNEMSKYNTYMLNFIMPNKYQKVTYNI